MLLLTLLLLVLAPSVDSFTPKPFPLRQYPFSRQRRLRQSSTSTMSPPPDQQQQQQQQQQLPDLTDKVAVVTGATRGIGKGIALELGLAGAIVYVCGRSSRNNGGPTQERDLGGVGETTVEQTAEQINDMPGVGRGIPIQCDVRNEEEIVKLMQRVRDDFGRLDILVTSAFTTPPKLDKADFRDEFWKQGAPMWDACHGVGLRGAYLCCCEGATLMIDAAKKQHKATSDNNPPLMVLISSFGGKSYSFNVAYGVGKAGCDRLASDMSIQLEKHGVQTVALYPGVVRTEGNVAMKERGDWDEASGGFSLEPGLSESPRFAGRAVTRLAGVPGAMEGKSGKVVVVAELAREMGFADIDGTVPPSIRSLRYLLPTFVFPQIERQSGRPVPNWISDNVPDYLLPWDVFTGGPPPDPV